MKYNRWQRDPNKDPEFAIMVRKHYAACITYADSLIGQLLGKLEKLGLRKEPWSFSGGIMVGISESMRFGKSMPSSRNPCGLL